jgi:alpha-ribazole phosphatase
MSTLWLLRHAHPLVDAGVCYGRLDVAADAVRTAQAAQDFSGLLPAGSVRHSPLRDVCNWPMHCCTHTRFGT